MKPKLDMREASSLDVHVMAICLGELESCCVVSRDEDSGRLCPASSGYGSCSFPFVYYSLCASYGIKLSSIPDYRVNPLSLPSDLLELAMVLHCSQLFWGVVHFSGELGDASIKMLVVWFFPCVR